MTNQSYLQIDHQIDVLANTVAAQGLFQKNNLGGGMFFSPNELGVSETPKWGLGR